MGLEISKNLYECVKDKMVSINSKRYGVTVEFPMDGKVVGYCFGSGTDMFLKLDNGKSIRFVNTKYIQSIEIIK